MGGGEEERSKGGNSEGKGWEERGPKAHSKNSAFGSGMARVWLADLNGPKSNGPLEAKMDHFGLANAKIQFGIGSFGPKWSFGPFWAILVQHTFRQYRGHSLLVPYD